MAATACFQGAHGHTISIVETRIIRTSARHGCGSACCCWRCVGRLTGSCPENTARLACSFPSGWGISWWSTPGSGNGGAIPSGPGRQRGLRGCSCCQRRFGGCSNSSTGAPATGNTWAPNSSRRQSITCFALSAFRSSCPPCSRPPNWCVVSPGSNGSPPGRASPLLPACAPACWQPAWRCLASSCFGRGYSIHYLGLAGAGSGAVQSPGWPAAFPGGPSAWRLAPSALALPGRAHLRPVLGNVELLFLPQMGLSHARDRLSSCFRNAAPGVWRVCPLWT